MAVEMLVPATAPGSEEEQGEGRTETIPFPITNNNRGDMAGDPLHSLGGPVSECR